MISEKGEALDSSVQYLKSVGPRRAESFRKVGINTIRDLLFYFPSRHLDRTTTLSAAKAFGYVKNGYDGELTVIAKVADKEKRRFGRKEIMKVQFRDETGFFECVWFHGIKYFYNVFNEGDIFALSGKPSLSKYDNLQFIHPDFDRITEDESRNLINTGKIIPFYRIPKELKSTNIGDLSLRRIVSSAVENYAFLLEETLPDNIIRENNLINLASAVKNYHYPDSREKLAEAKVRFKFEELFYLEILVALRKYNYGTKLQGNSFEIKTDLVKNFLKTLPFKLTGAQLRVLTEIKNDMLSLKPMNRLLQGDVGSGKTIVALIAMLIAADNGYQSVLMAPTEILADQHAKNISAYLKKLKELSGRETKLTLLLGGQRKSVKEKRRHETEMQEADIIVGTHALFEEEVKFRNPGLFIVDEQHRFGVMQRARLQNKAEELTGQDKTPDVIVMSATPIPRTLSMTVYGDLDVSVIDEMPKNRKPVKTILRGESKLPEIYRFIKDKNKEGYQSFIVYPLVEESEKLELKAARSYYEMLTQTYFKEMQVGLIHGRMSWQEKEETMLLFLRKKFDILIATTVIEVGIDIPDANIMLINDAQRFGLSQLHQLRGRVGRSGNQAYCILVAKDQYVSLNEKIKIDDEYLSSSQLEKFRSALRLKTMVQHNDGFKISEVDLKLRGPGDIFGTKQSGFPELKHADIIADADLIVKAKSSAFKMIEEDPHLGNPASIIIRKNLLAHYSDNLMYAAIA